MQINNNVTPTPKEAYVPGAGVEGMAWVDVVAVPYWIRDVLKLSKYELKDLFDYSKLSKIMTVRDIAEWVRFNEDFGKVFGDPKLYRFDSLTYRWHTKNEATYYAEFDKVIYPLASTAEVFDGLVERFKSSGYSYTTYDPLPLAVPSTSDPIEEVKPSFKTNIVTRTLVLVEIEKDFPKMLGDSDGRKKFTTECLQAMYSVAPITWINSVHDVFRNYLQNL